ncbi:Holliday junction resolvase RuvX [Alicyclobacillus fastidiosus]|uniref:Holliday junction resolvase RuvX n=1 Tax=Alicyclobacillus fastidiosus TaxID=392011 RepID=UPI0023B7746A|nr:Holliday junction resolvase RuvX [Alicyclobacillus fastidiosus]WEH11307.1 Holliday junction resolvase RuvX [Alicyclobacillus fastidiosus]
MALSDPMGFLASALKVIQRQSDKQVAADIESVVREYEVEHIVLGHPITMAGEVGQKAQHVERFRALLANLVSVPVELFDERLTTVSAQRVLLEADVSRKKRKEVVDAVAATILLQHYLDAKSH